MILRSLSSMAWKTMEKVALGVAIFWIVFVPCVIAWFMLFGR